MREGNLFSAYQSQDGSQWTLVGSDTVSMPATVYVGLAVTSHNPAATATATFSNVAVSTPTSANKPPTVSISAPASGASYTAPASIAITATAGDTDGSIVKVDFYAGTQLLGSDSSSPFTFTWNNVAAGTYSLTAVATDSAGAKTTSQAITVNVTVASASAPAKPTTLTFVPPTDYATNVTSLTLELRRSTDPIDWSSSGQQEPGQADAFERLGFDGYLDPRRSAPRGIVLRDSHQHRPVWIDEERSVGHVHEVSGRHPISGSLARAFLLESAGDASAHRTADVDLAPQHQQGQSGRRRSAALTSILTG